MNPDNILVKGVTGLLVSAFALDFENFGQLYLVNSQEEVIRNNNVVCLE